MVTLKDNVKSHYLSNTNKTTNNVINNTNQTGGTIQIKNATGGFSNVMEGSKAHQNWLKNNPDSIVRPGTMANNTASFSQNNLSGASGVVTNGKELTHSQALAQNPLHAVNGNRQSLIKEALKTGDNQPVLNFEAGQAPLHYSQMDDGNYTKTKLGLATQLESAVNDYNQAKNSGDATQLQLATSKLSGLSEQVRNAPGIMPHLSAFSNGGTELAKQFNIPLADAAWWNNGLPGNDLITKGYVGDKFWTENAVYRDNPDLLNQVLGLSGGYGSEKDQGIRQAINNMATSALGNNSFVNNQLGAEQSMQQGIQKADYDAYVQYLSNQHLRNHFDTTYGTDSFPNFTVNPYSPSPQLNQTQSAIQTLTPQQPTTQAPAIDPLMLMNLLNANQTPESITSGQGTLSSQQTQDDTLNKYLMNIWNGGL